MVMHRFSRAFLIIAFLACLCNPFLRAAGTTYYVATAGGGGDNAHNGLYPTDEGGSNGPWLTLAYAATHIAAGDTIQIRGGTYQDEIVSWTTNGTSGSRITITNYPTETPIFDGEYTIPIIGAAVVLAGVTEDYFETARGDDPDIGGHEYTGVNAVYYVDSSITDTYVASATPDFTTYNPVTFETTGGTDLVYKTIADVNACTFVPDDIIYFRKGQTWREQLTVPSSGTSGHPITFGAYGTGVNPIISGADLIIPGSSWANHSGNIWVATVTTQPYQVFFNGTRGTLVANHDACVAPLDWFWESNVLYVYGASDPDTLYTSPGIEAASRQFCIFGNIKSYLAIDGVDVCKTNGTYTIYGCITVYSGTDITVKNLEAKYGISNIGVIAISNFTVEDCTSTYALRAGIFAYNEGGEGGLVIRRNVASHNGYEGILLQGNPTLPRISSASIYGNTCDANSTGIYCHFTNSANIYDNICTNGHSLANEEYGIAMESCSSCSVHDNEVGDNDNQGISFYGGDPGGNSDYNLIYNNYVHGHTDGPGYAISFGAYATGFFNGNQVYYNLIPDQKYGILFDHENVGGVVYNNVVYGSSTAGMYIGDVNPGLAIKNNIIYGTTICLNANAVTTGLVHSNNCYYRESGTAVSYNGSTYTMANVTTFEASAMATDPLMTDPVGGIFTLQSSSPCINAGVDVGLTTDYLENPISGLPDIGAYEYVSVYYVDSSITDTYVGSATPDFVT